MSYRRVKDVGYDDDVYGYDDDYEEEEEFSPEDKEQLRQGAIKVKAAMGADSQPTDKEIQDALWHYYFDVDKSVAYLQALRRPKQTKQTKPKAESRFEQAAKASSSNGSTATKPAKSSATDTASEVADQVAGLSVKETKVQSKNLNVTEEFQKSNLKKSASFVVVGHVDHGKSTLMGRLLYDSKIVNEQTMRKYQKDSKAMDKGSFALAWVMDSTSDERARGITVDTATKFFETEKTRFTILDAPGHQDFIPNMIAGASQADFAVLVIDAGTNSFESGLRGQTKEHALLVRSMGVQRLIVAVNKMDRVEWSQERFKDIQQQLTAFLTTANFATASISFIPCAGLSGENILNKIESSSVSWYRGNTLAEELDSIDVTKRAIESPLRLTISEVNRQVAGNVSVSISGRIDAGSVQIGDSLLVQPASETAVVKSIEADEDPSAEWAVAGQIVTLSLVNIDPQHVHLGDILCATSAPVAAVKSFYAKILAFEHVLPMFVEVHRGRTRAPGKVAKLVATLDKASGEVVRKKPRVLQPGSVARVLIELEEKLPLEEGWKVVLRADGTSVAAGLVEKL